MSPGNLPALAFRAPGAYRFQQGAYYQELVRYGRDLRERGIWMYPDLPGALTTYGEIVASRQWKITGSPRAAARGVEYINNSVVHLDDGTIEFGFENFLKRRTLDQNVMGITMFTWDEDGLEYVDPGYVLWDNEKKSWELTQFEQRNISARGMIVQKVQPIGATSRWMSPVMMIMPTAIMAWLINEHDTAAADGRKIREIILIGSTEMADHVEKSYDEFMKIYSGRMDPSESGVNVIGVDLPPGMKMEDLLGKLGLANIPESLNRDDFQFRWMNQIATALGMPLRYFWNSEKATNRALEEVQEARSSQRGPGAFVRTEERLINRSGALKHINRKLRFSFIERVDMGTVEANAAALKANIEALKTLTDITSFQIDSEALIRWQQSLGSLPPDLEVLKHTVDSHNDETMPRENEVIASQTDAPGNRAGNAGVIESDGEKSLDYPDYGEVSIDSNGRVIERRAKVFTLEKAVYNEVIEDPDFIEEVEADYAQREVLEDTQI